MLPRKLEKVSDFFDLVFIAWLFATQTVIMLILCELIKLLQTYRLS